MFKSLLLVLAVVLIPCIANAGFNFQPVPVTEHYTFNGGMDRTFSKDNPVTMAVVMACSAPYLRANWNTTWVADLLAFCAGPATTTSGEVKKAFLFGISIINARGVQGGFTYNATGNLKFTDSIGFVLHSNLGGLIDQFTK